MRASKLSNSESVDKESALTKVGLLFGGYEEGFKVIKGVHPDAVESFLVLSSKGEPRLFLPTNPTLMKTAVGSFLGRWPAQLLSLVAISFARLGGPLSKYFSFASVVPTSTEPSPLRRLIGDSLERDDFQIALRVSFGRPNAKTVAMAISNSGEALCFVKLGSEALTGDLVAHESATLEKFEKLDMPVILPSIVYSGTWASGQSVLITESLDMEPLKRDADSAHSAASQLASVLVVENAQLADSAYWRRVTNAVSNFENNEELIETMGAIEKKWGGCSFDFGVGHGDWTRANLGLVNGKVAAIDWERCTDNAPKGLDIAHFCIAENSSWSKSRAIELNKVANSLVQYLSSANIAEHHAQPLIMLASLEMVIRFKSAATVGLPSVDTKFGQALREGMRTWAQS